MRYLAIALLLPVLAGGVAADEVFLNSGGHLEGRILEEGDKIKLETMTGVVTISKSDVTKINKSHTSNVERYYDKLEEVDKKDARAYLELAIWVKKLKGNRFAKDCVVKAAELIKGQGDFEAIVPLADASKESLGRELEPLWNRILSIDGTNEIARRALGYHLHEGKWLNEEEWQIAQGNVKYQGKWISREERDLILKEKELKLAKREKAVVKREKDVDRKLKKVEDALAKIDRELKKIEKEKADLARREAAVRERERELAGFTHCRFCDGYYKGFHICGKAWTYCKTCKGYFKVGHKCP